MTTVWIRSCKLAARAICCFAITFYLQIVCGQTTSGDPASWKLLIDDARNQFLPPDSIQVAQPRRQLLASIRKLDDWLSKAGENGKRWKKYFDLDQARRLAEQEDPLTAEDFSRLYHELGQCHQGYPGLELSPITGYAAAVERYASLREAAAPTAKADFERALSVIEETLKSGDVSQPKLLFAASVDQLRRWRQAPQLVAQIEKHYSRPNLLVQVSRSVAAAGIDRDLRPETMPVQDSILGASIHGFARARGHANLALVPSTGVAMFDVLIDVQHDSRNVSTQGPVSVSSVGHTELRARKRVLLDDTGLRVYPAMSSASIYGRITGVGTYRHGLRGRITRRVGARRAAERKPTVEAILAQHAEAKLNQRVEKSLAKYLYDVHQWYRDRFWLRLVRNGEVPNPMRFSTTTNSVLLVARQANKGHLAASTDPPALERGLDVAVRIHESFVNNTSCGMLAGKDRTIKEFRDYLAGLFGRPTSVPSKPEPSSPRIRFDSAEPVAFHFTQGGADLSIRGAAFNFGENWTEIPMNITVRYIFERDGLGLKLIRRGQVEVLPPGFIKGERLSIPELALRKQIMDQVPQMLSDLEGRKAWSQGLNFPGAWSDVGPMRLQQFSSEEGWLVLGWIPAIKQAALPSPESIVDIR